MLGVLESFEVLKDFPIVKTVIVDKKDDLKDLEYPCYLKVDSYVHKKQNGGVFYCDDETSANVASDLIKKNFPKNKIVAQPVVKGLQLVAGIKKDNVFGKVLMFGLGGSNLDEKNVTFRALKINRTEINRMFKDLKINEIQEYKYKEKLISLIEMISYFAIYNDVKELDLNPIILGSRGPLIVDARIEFEGNL